MASRESRQQIRKELGPKFANPQQREFFESHARELVYSGAFGAGKSRILCEKALYVAREYPGVPIAIVRKVAASLAATTRMTYVKDVLIPSGLSYRQHKTEGWIELPNGSRTWFFGLDPDPQTGMPSKVGSFDAAFIFVDEAVELIEADWIMLLGRLRYPSSPYRQLGAATNPGDPMHWLLQRFQPTTPDRQWLHASTFDNRLLPTDYLESMAGLTGIHRARYAEGQWVAVEGALWSPDSFNYREAPLASVKGELLPNYVRVVVAIDPAATSNADSDETGIVVAGLGPDHRGYVMDDQSCRATPNGWARRAVAAYHEHQADYIVAESNNGGEMVAEVIRTVDATVPVKLVTASRGKRVRAQPVASFYSEGRISHLRRFPELETQMCAFKPESNTSPDRMDALVWAFHELMVKETTYSGSLVGSN